MALVLGAGKMGRAIAYDLMKQGIDVRICDIREANIKNFFKMNVRNEEDLEREMKKEDIAISALPYDFNYKIAKIAIKTKTDFLDLGGNSEIVKKELMLDDKAKKEGISIIPDCGLAPGMTNIIAYHIWNNSKEVHIRVGGLPQKPRGALKYSLFFSVHGLLNEYIEDSIIIRDGKVCRVKSLSGVEKIHFRGFKNLEAFYTHGGTSTLLETMKGVRDLDYKTIRYRGHAEKIRVLKELGFFEKSARKFTEKILEKTLSKDEKDVVLARIYTENNSAELLDYYDEKENFSAMARTTGFSTSIIAKMVINGEIEKGAKPPELAVDGNKFLKELKKRRIIWEIT
ncbi:MAG: saccharopine dehydrogenase NADP-binding domain-containing protein [Thermoplasmatales archaeon]|nr:saccharopine dehydrogenase NADP-binding domain-containing protein [Thermoplasmatales archaeon]